MSGMQGMGPAWRHLRSDRSVVNNRVDRRTLRRVLAFAGPHHRLIGVFLALTVIDAGLVVVTPAAGPADRRRRHPQAGRRPGHRAGAGDGRRRPCSSALLTVAMGYLSSRIGEGLIFDLRTQVFAHVQRQSLAFFTRTQTGALVVAAQQRRDRRPARLHLDAVQHGLQRDLGGRRRDRDVRAELAGDAAVPGAVPAAVPRPRAG